ncbi:4-(cytidine 5'-diphospho)-2-C-methyl-D-erythritol kinase [Roseobacter sp.]|uniref:4-(cytidine 5'-diphospho)-2-C-methyl-D-erythritol kinase n=1 Tax=Roseobacter sp. TaxID=1907202 RepID=UPI00385F1DDA
MSEPAQAVRVFAPAKINLTLHVTGQRSDGYHFLDSLVAFADVGDTLIAVRHKDLSLRVHGPESSTLPESDENLVLRVARLFGRIQGCSFQLTKELPVASGIGGGSADAAASFRALSALFDTIEPSSRRRDMQNMPQVGELVSFGADIPMCVGARTARVTGIGEHIKPVAGFPPLYAVLVNPRRSVSTPTVFKALQQRDHPPMSEELPEFAHVHQVAAWLGEQRNDLEAAAISVEPAISQTKTALSQSEDCLLARMSGSGATCFGLFPDMRRAEAAAASISRAHTDWWVRATQLGDQHQRAQAQLMRSTT